MHSRAKGAALQVRQAAHDVRVWARVRVVQKQVRAGAGLGLGVADKWKPSR